MKESLVFDETKKIAHFKNFPIIHCFSTTRAGNMSYRWGTKEAVDRNRKDLYRSLRLDIQKEVHILPEFKSKITIVTKENQGENIQCDGLVTTAKNLPLSLYPADCLPIILTTADFRLAAIIHGSRKSIVEHRIAEKAVRKISESFKISPQELIVGIGPGIGQCHYDLNLPLLIETQLRKMEIPKANIRVADACTYCSQFEGNEYVFFSHQRTKNTGEKESRFAAVVVLKSVR